jgi:hypothetical protein
MVFLTQKDEERSGGVTIPEPIIVVEGTIMRMTGGGNFVVYPDQHGTDAHEGSRVIILNSIGNRVPVSLEVIREHVSIPYASDLTLVVGARKRVEGCNAWCDDRKLFAQDSVGTPQSELPLPVGGYVYFRIPEEMKMENDTMVEIRNGSVTLRRERFGNIVGATEIAPRGQYNNTDQV